MQAGSHDADPAAGNPRPAPDPALTAIGIVRAAEDLVPLLRERAAAADAARRIDPGTYRLLEDAGFFHILKPKKYGGLELSEHEHARVAMTLARGRRRRRPHVHRAPRGRPAPHLRRDVLVLAVLRPVHIYSLVGAKAGNPGHPVSLAKRDIEVASHHVTLNWRQSAVRYLAAVTAGQPPP